MSEAAGESVRRRVAVVTGSRAEFGLLAPVMRAVRSHPNLQLLTIAAGSHLIPPAETFRDVKAEFEIADSIPMQVAGRTTRADDAEALGRGTARFARSFEALAPDWVVVLGDRIEALAAASAASVGGWALAHVHGGDRAEGIADEAMRHAVTKLAHLHFPATALSAQRIIHMGEPPEHVHIVGSPALDDLPRIAALDDDAFAALGRPTAVLLLHPLGRSSESEEHVAGVILDALAGHRVLALEPNHDPGRDGILRALRTAVEKSGTHTIGHMPRSHFVGLLRRLALRTAGRAGGVLVGNSSAALIECAAIACPAVNIGPRQAGREHGGNVVHAPESSQSVRTACAEALSRDLTNLVHPFGDGQAGRRIAAMLAATDPRVPGFMRKRCAY